MKLLVDGLNALASHSGLILDTGARVEQIVLVDQTGQGVGTVKWSWEKGRYEAVPEYVEVEAGPPALHSV